MLNGIVFAFQLSLHRTGVAVLDLLTAQDHRASGGPQRTCHPSTQLPRKLQRASIRREVATLMLNPLSDPLTNCMTWHFQESSVVICDQICS